MNSLVEILNAGGGGLLDFAWPMLWQSSLLAVSIFAVDLALRRKVRAAVRYTLWLVLLAKLLLPPSLALPTGIAWWLRPTDLPRSAQVRIMVASYPDTLIAAAPVVETIAPPMPVLSAGGWMLFGSGCFSAGLFGWLLLRWRHVNRQVRNATTAPEELRRTLAEAQRLAGVRGPVRVKITGGTMSPAVCGLFRPVILMPRTLVEKLPAAQLRAVLVHELIHLRRGDVWVNCAQALLQVVYWWHPLVWLANARIRRVREEAVDDAVMLALADGADAYAPTLIEVAKLAFHRPLASLGLIGILESKSALRQRIERLVNFRAPGRPGLTAMSVLGIAVFTAAAVPMGEAPANSDVNSRLERVVRNAALVKSNENSGEISPPDVAITNTPAAPATPSLKALAFDADMKQINVSTGALQARFVFNVTNVSAAPAVITSVATSCGCTVAQLPATPWVLDPGAIGQLPVVMDLTGRQGIVAKVVTVMSDQGNKTLIVRANMPFRAVANPAARTNSTVYDPAQRQAVVDKLASIRFERVAFDRAPLSEVVSFLRAETRKSDPAGKGINFLVNTNVNPAAVDPNSGLPQAASPSVDLMSLPITIRPPLTDVPVQDVLEAVAKAAGTPIRFSIENFGVVLSPGAAGETMLRRSSSPEPVPASRDPIKAAALAQDGRLLFQLDKLDEAEAKLKAALDLDPENKEALYYFSLVKQAQAKRSRPARSDVRPTLISSSPSTPQVSIKARFVGLSSQPDLLRGLGWLVTNNATAGPNQVSDWSNCIPAATTILTDAQFRKVLRTLEKTRGVDILSEGQVSMLTGRQAQLQVRDETTIVTGINPQALQPPGITGTNSVFQTAKGSTMDTMLDVVPSVSGDGTTVELWLRASLTEFVGYSKSTNCVVYIDGKKQTAAAPLVPRVRSLQISARAIVWDGQTIVLAGLTRESRDRVKNKTPVLGDLPLMAPLFRSDSQAKKTDVLVFVTPTIIKPTGERVHADAELPSAKNSIPTQNSR